MDAVHRKKEDYRELTLSNIKAFNFKVEESLFIYGNFIRNKVLTKSS
jgi:hypothetical protein